MLTSSNQTATQNVTSIANSMHHHPTTIQSSVHVRMYCIHVSIVKLTNTYLQILQNSTISVAQKPATFNEHHAQNNCSSPVSSVSSRTSPLPNLSEVAIVQALSQPLMNGPTSENKVSFIFNNQPNIVISRLINK